MSVLDRHQRSGQLLGLVLLLGVFRAEPVSGEAVRRGTIGLTLDSSVARSVSRQCAACHSAQFSLWVDHPHSHSLIDPSRNGRLARARWGTRIQGWQEYVEGRFSQEDVALVIGVLERQVQFRRDLDGYRLLPGQWTLKGRRWDALPEELEQVRTSKGTWEDLCAGCHTSGFDPTAGTFEEASVSCVACHGDVTAHLASGGDEPTAEPTQVDPELATEICGSCHSRGRSKTSAHPYPVGFSPGASLRELYDLEEPRVGSTIRHFWPDGTERLSHMQYQGFIQSRHHEAGVRCIDCHNPHGCDNEHSLRRKSSALCRGCHGSTATADCVQSTHPGGTKASCVDCHMSPTDFSPAERHVHTHTFRFLEPSMALDAGMPSSCTVECHPDRNARWSARVLADWRETE